MSSKDKTFKDHLKDIFKRNKSDTGSYGSRGDVLFVSEDLLKDLGKDSPLATRLKILKHLNVRVTESKVEEGGIEKLWKAIEDLFGNEHTTEIRNAAFLFTQYLIRGQYERMKLLRAHFFRFIKSHNHPEDVRQRFELLNTLTCNGKDITHFDEEIGCFLLSWVPDITRTGKLEEYLNLIDNMIKFNASYLSDEIITGFIHHICTLCCSTSSHDTVVSCLRIMSTVVAYSNMSPESLPKFLGTLCRTVIVEKYCNDSWKIVKDLLGTHLGHSTLFTMCRILQEKGLRSDADLLRGAIFFIHMALWGNTSFPNLLCPPTAVMPSFLQAIQCNQPAVAYEMMFGIQHLVNKHGSELHDPCWDAVLKIVAHIIQNIDISSTNQPNKLIAAPLHETLNNIERLIDKGDFNGNPKQFFEVLELCAADRPENSVVRLLVYLSHSIVPTEHLWLTKLHNMLQKYFKLESRSNIRLKVLDILSEVIKLNRRVYEDELIDRIVLPHMTNIVQVNDIVIRASVANLIIDFCMECETKRCLELLEILEKLLYRPFEAPSENIALKEGDVYDINCVVSGLIKVFTHKIFKLPSSHAIKIYKMLVCFLEQHYKRPKLFENCPEVRKKIFDCFLRMRADKYCRLGCAVDNKMKFSAYLCVMYRAGNRTESLGSPPPTSQSPTAIHQIPPCIITHVSLRNAFKIVITCLKQEKDWEVLSLVLRELTRVLQNRSLILAKTANTELDLLVNVLCSMITDKSLNLPDSLNVRVSKPDFHALVLLVLVNLASYHSYMDHVHQQKMIRCLVKGTNSAGPRSSRHCIAALTVCTLEMREVMVKMLPEVLLSLSKISATVHIAIPVLEFLSTLTQLPTVYASFVADQYMAVFAISLPYTNPFRYDHYTVSLAHHVIAVWFLKCRVPFRKDFVKFITQGLQTNVLVPFEDNKTIFNQSLSELNQDSSDRKRSSSLTEQSSRKRIQQPVRLDKPLHRPASEKSLTTTFYEELTETCIDLMARYAFSPCTALPRRLPVAEFLLKGGQSMCWLVGNKLVTVTTSGCSQKILKNGVCDKCWIVCKSGEGQTRGGSNDDEGTSWGSRQGSNEKSSQSGNSPVEDKTEKDEPIAAKMKKIMERMPEERELCSCWCSGWAEIHVRRPTGNMSWVMRIQNPTSLTNSVYEFPLRELSTLFMSSLIIDDKGEVATRPPLRRQPSEDQPNPEDERASVAASETNSSDIPGSPRQTPSRQNSRDSVEDESDCQYDDGSGRSRNPVRRSNSSPEMSASWKNPFLHQKGSSSSSGESEESKCLDEDGGKKAGKMYSKDMRVSCEAIPEEIAGSGTTPPSSHPFLPPGGTMPQQEQQQPPASPHHPSLLSCYSYPGSSAQQASTSAPKMPHSVPPTPSVSMSSQSQQPPEFVARRPANLVGLTPGGSGSGGGKPPQSPTQLSPRPVGRREKEGHEIQKSSSSSVIEKNPSGASLSYARELAKERKNSGSVERLTTLDAGQTQKRDRVHTISVMSPATRKTRADYYRQATRTKDVPKSGINPSFVFLQLYHAAYFGSRQERPIVVQSQDSVQRAMWVLDSIPPYETHKIGVIYVKEGQTHNEVEIYRNKIGSMRYVDFLQNLGFLVKLEDLDPQVFFLGGLDQHGNDGKFAYVWQDDVIKVMFHVATLMPNKDSDPNCNDKRMHIANDYVTIVYNESGEEFNISTIKGQFTFACVIVQPLEYGINRVTVKIKEELSDIIPMSEPKLVSDQTLPSWPDSWPYMQT
ncbi:unnamed protein product [Acanthoscelides obtectus]|uniref:Rap-GAP domain-containing protein n=1 Tax=Acanthoscelides obtectus TaxID=200917 RepID=A0A9P0PHV2_ACAOB|nr:unnamed protein product [Acanthoscelides obtectus]CAK1630062.1 Tuberin [Acanthoscelides obtectus]